MKALKSTFYKTASIPRDTSAENMTKMLNTLGKSFCNLSKCEKWEIKGEKTDSHIIVNLQCEAEEKNDN